MKKVKFKTGLLRIVIAAMTINDTNKVPVGENITDDENIGGLIDVLKSKDNGQDTVEFVELELTDLQKQVLGYSMSQLGLLLIKEAYEL